MSTSLPDFLDPWRAVDSCTVLGGHLPVSSLPRLCGLLFDQAGDVTFRLAFSRDEDHRAVLRCEVSATLILCCQRCLGTLEHRVGTSVLLALISGIEEERRLPDGFDPLLMEGGPLHLRDLVEDELLLALPQIPMHERELCPAGLPKADKMQSGGESPFAVLGALKRVR